MLRNFLTAKLHHARVTRTEPEYEGSCAIDGALLEAAGIGEYEQLHIYNVENGARLTTYAIRAREQSGVISLNGAAAHKAQPGDRIIICTFGVLEPQEVSSHKPTLIYLDADNRIVRCGDSIPVQVA